jgi:hypothetical protein
MRETGSGSEATQSKGFHRRYAAEGGRDPDAGTEPDAGMDPDRGTDWETGTDADPGMDSDTASGRDPDLKGRGPFKFFKRISICRTLKQFLSTATTSDPTSTFHLKYCNCIKRMKSSSSLT